MLFFLLITQANRLVAQNDVANKSVEKYSRIKVSVPKTIEEREMLLSLLEIDHYYIQDGYIISEISNTSAKLLKSLPYKYSIICDDVAAELAQKNAAYYAAIKNNPAARVAFENSDDTLGNLIKTPAAFEVKSTFGGYYSYDQMVTAIGNLYNTYPSIVDTFSIGKTYEGRNIWCVKISDNVKTDENEPEIGYMGLQHAREAIGGSSMIFFMQYLCENYATDARIKNLVDNREFFIIPCMNADGWEYNRSTDPNGGGGWRKNREPYGSDYGVDLNRNWSVRWADCSAPISGPPGNCGSNSPSSSTYWGPSAFSEPETKAVRNFTKTRHFSIFLDQHSVGPYYSIPPGRQQDVLPATDLSFYKELCSHMGKYNGMKYGNSYEALAYEVAGGVKDWMLTGEIGSGTKGKVYGFTGEGSSGGGTSGSYGGFWPPADKIVILCKGMVYQNLQMAYFAGSYFDLQDLGSLNLSTTTGFLNYRVRRLGLVNKPFTISVIPLQNISVGTSKTASLTNFDDILNDKISYSLPTGISNGNVIKYIWKLQTEGCIYYDTIIKIYKGSNILSDDMESGSATTNWTITAGTAASPTWAYSTNYSFAGSRSLANAPSTKLYGTDAVTRTAQWKNKFSLSGAGTAYLSFMVKGRAENFCDKLEVQISTNGSTWTSLSGKTTIKEPNDWDGSTINGTPALTGIHEEWMKETFDLKDYLGLNNLRFRFVFSTTNTDANYKYNTDEGFFIDDLELIAGGSASIRLPLELISFTGHRETPNNVLNWSTASEKNTAFFGIERTVNGVDFETIGKVAAAGNSTSIKNYTFADEKPYIGQNLYRLKMVDIDGTYTYSKLVSITVKDDQLALKPSGIDKLFPNPTTGNINVDFNITESQATLNVLVIDIIGRIVYSQPIQVVNGSNQFSIDATTFPSGQYLLSIINPENNVTYEQKFIKQ